MALKLPPLYVKGEPRSIIEASESNLILSALTALSTVQVVPQGFGVVKVGETSVVFDMTQLSNTITSLVSDALTKAGISAGGGASLVDRVAAVEQRLNNASASGTCSGSNISIQFNI